MLDTIVSLTLTFQEIQLKDKKKTSDFLVERNKLKSIITIGPSMQRQIDPFNLSIFEFDMTTREREEEKEDGMIDQLDYS